MNDGRINGFTDIHTHILPFVDDGAKDMEQALQLVKLAWENGTRTLFLTPHYRGVYKKNTPEHLRKIFDDFCREVHEVYPEIKLYLGNEIYYQMEAPERLSQGRILPLCGSRYALLEFQGSALRSQIIMGVSETVRHGYVPVIAHAERYAVFRTDWSLLEEVLEIGALIQLNADSVMGRHGFWVKRFCSRVLTQQLAHFIASDAHDTASRKPLLRTCYLHIHKKYGAEYAARVFYSNAQAIIANKII